MWATTTTSSTSSSTSTVGGNGVGGGTVAEQQPPSNTVATATPPALVTGGAVGTGTGVGGMVGRVGGAAADGSYERRLILELCPPGGYACSGMCVHATCPRFVASCVPCIPETVCMHASPSNPWTRHHIMRQQQKQTGGTRAVPPPDKLAAFLKAAGTLDVETVGGVVLDLLGEESWQVRDKRALGMCMYTQVRHALAHSHFQCISPTHTHVFSYPPLYHHTCPFSPFPHHTLCKHTYINTHTRVSSSPHQKHQTGPRQGPGRRRGPHQELRHFILLVIANAAAGVQALLRGQCGGVASAGPPCGGGWGGKGR